MNAIMSSVAETKSIKPFILVLCVSEINRSCIYGIYEAVFLIGG